MTDSTVAKMGRSMKNFEIIIGRPVKPLRLRPAGSEYRACGHAGFMALTAVTNPGHFCFAPCFLRHRGAAGGGHRSPVRPAETFISGALAAEPPMMTQSSMFQAAA